MSSGNSEYIAGVCNIDIIGIRYRKRIAFITAVTGIVVLGVMFYFRIDPLMRFIAAAGFAAGAALNILQAAERFCIANALAGTSEENLRRKKLSRTDDESRRDRRKVVTIVVKTVITALAAGTFALLPV
jgi:hypothetical protein